MKHWNWEKVKRYAKRSMALLFCLGCMLPLMQNNAVAFDSAEVVSKIQRGKLYLFKWTPLMDGDKARHGANYVTMLNEKNKVIRGTNKMKSGPDEAQIVTSSKYTPYSYGSRLSTDVFYTLGSMGAPIIYNVGDDDDNNGYQHTYWLADENYPYAPRQAINRDGGGDWDEFSQDYGMSLMGNSQYSNWIDLFLDGREPDLGQYNEAVSFFTLSTVEDGGKFMIFKNISRARDPAWQCYDNGNIWCDQESSDSARCWFNIWYGDPTVYSTLTQSYTIGDGQTLTLDSETENYRGIYIPPTVTLTVKEGATLAINENVYNDGTILCDGGTVIIQGSGSLSPMSNDSSGTYNTNGKNKIIVQNGGVLIIMPGGKLYTTQKYPMTLIGARMINFGGYVMGGNMELYSSVLENRQGGKILCGWNFTRADLRPEFEDIKVENIESRYYSHMQGGSVSTITVYDTDEHVNNNDWLVGDLPSTATISLKKYSVAGLKDEMQKAITSNSAPLNIVK